MKDKNHMTEAEFLESYNPGEYEKPSVTADILIFTIGNKQDLELLLIKRGGHPYLGKWAIPGGFVGIDEDLETAAQRELKEETGLEDVYLEQLYTFGGVNRDPRMRVISVAYLALIPKDQLSIHAGDDAADAKLFHVSFDDWEIAFEADDGTRLSMNDMAFDHKDIIQMGLKRLAGKLDYTDIAFEFLDNKREFTIYEIQKIHEAIKGKKMDAGNFRRDFKRKYVMQGVVIELPNVTKQHVTNKARCYCYKNHKEDMV